jgi:hypothetical protein
MDFRRVTEFVSVHKLGFILGLGIAVRLVLMPISAHPFDVYVWYTISQRVLNYGPFYLQGFPPLWYHYMMVPLAYTYAGLATVFSSGVIPMSSVPSAFNFYPSYSVQVIPGLLFDFVVKVPFLISDVLVTLLLYKIVKELTKSKRAAETAALLWFLNPFVIWISAVWGMWDTLPVLFSLAALYLVSKKRFAFSAVCLSLGVALKLYPALFLLPLAFYLYRSSAVSERWKNFAKFYGVFAGASLILFLPYLGTIEKFLISFSSLHIVGASVISPLGPVGFGITYWSIYLLYQWVLNVSLSGGFIFLISLASLLLVAVSLGLVYWWISKLVFRNPTFDLSVAMLLSIFALFLSYRAIPEQYLTWALPFLIILIIGGRIRKAYYWAASSVALLYAVLNCPLPFFFLPLAPWATNTLLSMVHFIWWIGSLRFIILVALGCASSFMILLVSIKLIKKQSI